MNHRPQRVNRGHNEEPKAQMLTFMTQALEFNWIHPKAFCLLLYKPKTFLVSVWVWKVSRNRFLTGFWGSVYWSTTKGLWWPSGYLQTTIQISHRKKSQKLKKSSINVDLYAKLCVNWNFQSSFLSLSHVSIMLLRQHNRILIYNKTESFDCNQADISFIQILLLCLKSCQMLKRWA